VPAAGGDARGTKSANGIARRVSRGSPQIRNRARRRGIEVGPIDAVLAQLSIRYELRLLTTDADFARIAEAEPLERWMP